MKNARYLGGAAALALTASLAFSPAVWAEGMQPASANETSPTARSSEMNASQSAPGAAEQIPLTKVNAAETTLSSASVIDKDGNTVGSVQEVVTTPKGKVKEVRVDAGGFLGVGSKIVSLPAKSMKYERDRNTLVTPLTKDQITALPEVKA